MLPINLRQLAEILKGRFQNSPADPDRCIARVSIDSRTIESGDLFIAIHGDVFDGHDFAAAAAGKGACCIIAERPVDMPGDAKPPVLLVDDTLAALGKLAAWYRRRLKAKVIAITGSAGKTTTRQMLSHVLSRFHRCRQAQKSFNNHIGVPLTILSAEAEDEFLVLELGTNHPGEIAYLTHLSKPDAAAITLIGPAHLEGFGTLANILREKASIAEGLAAGGTLYANGDQPELVDYLKKTYDVRVITSGTVGGCDIIGTQLNTNGPSGSLVIDGVTVSVPLPGVANLRNCLTVWSICRDCNISLSDFAEAVTTIPPVAMRLEVQTIGPVTVLNDCYNANPASMANALNCLGAMAKEKGARAVFVAGSMGELGEQAAQLHLELGRTAAAAGIELLLACGPFAPQIVTGAKQARGDLLMEAYEGTAQLCDNLHKWLQPDDIVLVKGSRSAGLEKAIAQMQQRYKS
jgi:UDP-N-acetylmuramoyl-tripeptide--D-alanyl-D-alanine ligase